MTEGVIEPFVTLASLIHLVPRLHLGISALVLPQRNAIIVAKQAAALDLLSEGRFVYPRGGHRVAGVGVQVPGRGLCAPRRHHG